VLGFTLVNATTDAAISDPLASLATIDLFVTGPALNIRANTDPAAVGSVRFALDGNPAFHVENVAPYALAGHAGGDYLAWTPGLGAHTLTATPFSGPDATGTAGDPVTITFTVVDTTPPVVTSVTLIDAALDASIADPLASGATIDLFVTGPALNIRANTDPATVGSVRFGLDANPSVLVENTAPYALAGHNGTDYLPWTPALGAHTLTVTPFSGANATGTAGTPYVITFTVVDSTPPAVASLTLINAATESPLGAFDPLVDGATVDLAVVGSQLNVRANTDPAVVGSVRFGLDGNASFSVRNTAPYALAGYTGGDYLAWTPSVGDHTITVTPFSGANATGIAGVPFVVTIHVIDTTPPPPPAVNKSLTTPSTAVGPTVLYDDQAQSGEQDLASWVGPTLQDSLIFVTQKGGRVDVWNVATHQIVATLGGYTGQSAVAVDQAAGVLYVSDKGARMVRKYLISDIRSGVTTPILTFTTDFSPSSEPEGLAVYNGAEGTLIYVIGDGGTEKAIRAFRPDGTLSHWWSLGNIAVQYVTADDENGLIFVGDDKGDQIAVYRADGTFVRHFGAGIFVGKTGGSGLYRCGSDGYFIASNPGLERFEVFDRLSFQHLGSFRLQGVGNTKGIAIAQSPLSGYPDGAMFAQTDEKWFFGVSWTHLNQATGMTTCMR
jgi:hypothetical protein